MKVRTGRGEKARALHARNSGWPIGFFLAGQLALVLFVTLAAVQQASQREPAVLDIPLLRGPDSGEVIALDENGEQRWTQQWSQTVKEMDGRTLVFFRETGEGVHSPFKDAVRWEVSSVWESGSQFRPREMEREFYDLGANLLQRETMFLDWEHETAEFIRTTNEESPEREMFEIPPDTLIVSGIAVALRGFPFNSGEKVKAHLLTNEPHLYEIEIEDRGLEEVSVPAGIFDSYRLKLNVNLGFLNLFRVFLPDTYFWFDASSPHPWLRYQGLEGGRGTPQIEMKLVEMGSKRDRAGARVPRGTVTRARDSLESGVVESVDSSGAKDKAVRK